MSSQQQHSGNILAHFNPEDHLITLKTADGPTACYPHWWQLHEFHLRHPDGEIEAQVVHFDLERDFVLVKVVAHSADGFGTGFQSGSLTLINQVTARAKAQALLDLGIGCAWPILFRDDLERADVVMLPHEQVSAQPQEQSASPLQQQQTVHVELPVRTPETVKQLFAKAFKVPSTQVESRWQGFKIRHIGLQVPDADLTQEQLTTLHAAATQQYEHVLANQMFAATAPHGGSKNGTANVK